MAHALADRPQQPQLTANAFRQFRKIRRDFDAKGIGQSDHQIRNKMADLMGEAVVQLETEAKG